MDQLLEARLSRLAQAIGRLERKTDFILKELKLEYTDDPDSTIPPELAEMAALLKQGKKLQAIQAYRKLTGVGVDEAMVEVEEFELGLIKK